MSDLAPTTSGTIAEHQDIIRGYETIYGILIDLGYVHNTDVQVPPHGMPKDPIAVAPLRAAGLDPATIELIGRLPCFSNRIIERQRHFSNPRDGIPIAPFSSAASYLLGSGRHDEAREVGAGPAAGEELLPPSAFKIASTSDPQGCCLAYDLSDKTVLKWHPDSWGNRQRISSFQFLQEWTHNIRTLHWLPWQDDMGWEMEVKRNDSSDGLADPESSLVQGQIEDGLTQQKSNGNGRVQAIENTSAQQRLVSNNVSRDRYWARRHIYEQCGWPDAFNRDEFLRRRDEWNAKVKELGPTDGDYKKPPNSADASAGLQDSYRTPPEEHD